MVFHQFAQGRRCCGPCRSLISEYVNVVGQTRAPMPCSSFWVVLTPASMGTVFRRRVPEVKSPAHISGRGSVFAPDTVISAVERAVGGDFGFVHSVSFVVRDKIPSTLLPAGRDSSRIWNLAGF